MNQRQTRKYKNMKTKRLLIILSAVFIAFSAITFLSSMKNPAGFFQKNKNKMFFITGNLTGLNLDYIIPGKNNPLSGDKNGNRNGNQVKGSKALNMNWQEVGPDNFAGRTRAILIDKDNENLIFAGSAGGGIWKSTTGGLSWVKVTGGDMFDNLCVSSICQASNGDIYFGTGEYYGSNTSAGFRGQGIFKSTDKGETWSHLQSTWNAADSLKQIFYYVNKIATDPTNSNKIYAATAKGLRVSNDGGNTWVNPVTDANAGMICTDVQVSNDGQVVVISLNNLVYVSNTGNNVFEIKSGTNLVAPFDSVPTGLGRIEFSIAPSNSNYIYCLAADATGALKNVYKSTNKGAAWEPMIQVVNGNFLPFGLLKLGIYDNVIKVFPDDPEHLLLGGYNLFEWTPSKPWQQISFGVALYPGFQSYVQSGIHTIVFPSNYSSVNNIVYVGTDGGLFKGVYGMISGYGYGYAWEHLYKNYNTAQFHSVSFSASGKVIGGSRNNGTLYFSQDLTNAQDAKLILEGDAGYCEFSQLNPDFIYSTNPYGILGRSYDEGKTFSTASGDLADIYTTKLTNKVPGIGTSTAHPFVTPIRLWESFYDTNSTQFILVEAPKKLVYGDTIDVVSPSQRVIKHLIDSVDLNGQDTILKYDTLYVKDTYQSMIAVGFSNSVWISRQAHDMSEVPPIWYRPTLKIMNQIQTLEFSADGDILYFADYSSTGDTSRVFRISNLTNGRDMSTGDADSAGNVLITQSIGTFQHKITGIAVDPQNSGNIIVTIGGYGYTDYVYYSAIADTTTSTVMNDNFVVKQGTLTAMPVYCSLILWNDSKKVILGTESGIYATEDITAASPVWTEQNADGMARVPVLQLRQQIHPNGWLIAPVVEGGINTGVTNHGYIYAATFGRGIFVCDDFKGPVNVPEISYGNQKASQIVVYPNPAKDEANISFTLNKRSDVRLTVFDITGNVVKTIQLKNLNAGNQNINFSTSDLSTGTYIAQMEMNGTKNTAKFIIN